MRYFIFSLLAVVLLGGCTVKEFGKGVDDGIGDVKRVIRGNNN
ncbi:MAG: hypothetical protein Q8S36_04740 [Sulfuricurvum sp.]|nr:hypothetical protein [Sulfuricurvum sp.]